MTLGAEHHISCILTGSTYLRMNQLGYMCHNLCELFAVGINLHIMTITKYSINVLISTTCHWQIFLL